MEKHASATDGMADQLLGLRKTGAARAARLPATSHAVIPGRGRRNPGLHRFLTLNNSVSTSKAATGPEQSMTAYSFWSPSSDSLTSQVKSSLSKEPS